MTILELLATTDSPDLVNLIDARRPAAPVRTVEGWNNKPSWDNWAQKPKPFKKKTVYFRNR